MYAGISKSIGGGVRVGTYFRLNGSHRSVPVYSRESCNKFRDELHEDMRAACIANGIKPPVRHPNIFQALFLGY